MKLATLAAGIALCLAASAAAAQAPAPAAPGAQTAIPASAAPPGAQLSSAPLDYKLGVADRVRLLVYNEPTLSGEFPVNANGAIAVPLIGDVNAVGRTTTELTGEITARLADGYLRDPKVSMDVLVFRPFYILGEVQKPGQYPYVTGLTVQNAVATAQGFTYRADKRRAFIKGANESAEHAEKLTPTLSVNPGDTIRIGERLF